MIKDQLTCTIIDDEPLAQEILEEYIKKVPFLKLLGSYESAIEASVKVREDKPDLIFLDINMPHLDGLSFIPMLEPRPAIILTTAYDQYALKAYELDVIDYFLKPIAFDRFYKGVLKAYQSLNVNRTTYPDTPVPKTEERDYIFIKTGTMIKKIAADDIHYVEGMKDYLRIYTEKEKIMALLSFAKLEEILSSDNFVRVHKSWLVSVRKINHVEKDRIYIGDKIIPVSGTYKEVFYKRLGK